MIVFDLGRLGVDPTAWFEVAVCVEAGSAAAVEEPESDRHRSGRGVSSASSSSRTEKRLLIREGEAEVPADFEFVEEMEETGAVALVSISWSGIRQ